MARAFGDEAAAAAVPAERACDHLRIEMRHARFLLEGPALSRERENRGMRNALPQASLARSFLFAERRAYCAVLESSARCRSQRSTAAFGNRAWRSPSLIGCGKP